MANITKSSGLTIVSGRVLLNRHYWGVING